MHLFTFCSTTRSHVQLACGFERWALSPSDQTGVNKGILTKITRYVSPGDLGIFYISDKSEHCLTMPFIIASLPVNRTVSSPWGGVWQFPFKIQCLGSPSRSLSISKLRIKFSTRKLNYHSSPIFSFAPNKSMSHPDIVSYMLEELAHDHMALGEKRRLVDAFAGNQAMKQKLVSTSLSLNSFN